MAKNSDVERMSGSVIAIISAMVLAFMALIYLMFSLDVGSGIF